MLKPKCLPGVRAVVFSIFLLILILMPGLTEAVHAEIVNINLSGALIDAGDVSYFRISPDGLHVVFVADANQEDVEELFCVPVIGGPRVSLYQAEEPNQDILARITPDSSHVVFLVGGSDRVYDFFAVPITGGSVVKLFEGGRSSHGIFTISEDSKNVFFVEELSSPVYHEIIWRLPIDGSGAVQISPETCGDCRYEFEISPDSQNIVYLESKPSTPPVLFHSDLDGTRHQLAQGVVDFEITPDGNHVVYREVLSYPKINLYAVPVTGGPAHQLNGDLVDGGQVTRFKTTPDSQYVVYLADENLDEQFLLYAVRVDGSDRWPLITLLVPTDMDVVTFDITPNSLGVVFKADPFVADRYDLFSVSIMGGTPIHLSHELPDFDYISSVRLAPSSLGVVYAAIIEHGLTELFAVSIFGTQHVKLNAPLPDGGKVHDFRISPNSQGVVYLADQEVDNINNLYAVPIVGGVAPLQLNGPLVEFGEVLQFSITPDSKGVVYRADQDIDGKWELFVTYDYQRVYLPLLVH